MKGEHGTLLQLHCKIANAASQLSYSTEFPGLGAQVTQLLREGGLGFTSLCVYLIDREQRKGRNYYLHPGPAGWIDQGFTMDMAPLVAHVEERARMWQDPHSQTPLWFLTVPTSLGAVEIAAHRPEAFSPEEQELLSCLAPSLQLLAIRHRDLEMLENLSAHTTRAAEDLEILRGSSSELYGSDSSLVAQRIVQVVLEKFSFDRAGIFLVDEKAGLLRGAWGVDQRGEIVPISSTVLPLRSKRPEQLSQAARLVRGELDYFLTQDLDGEGGRSTEGNIAANLAVPLRLGRRIIGVLCVDNYFTARSIGQEQVLPLMLLANQAALALENSSLHQELKRAKEGGLEELETAGLLPGRLSLRQRQDEPDLFGEIVAQSPGMRQVVELARLATTTDNTVLILGESGTGKDLLAHAIHAHSRRRAGPLVVVNSASLSSICCCGSPGPAMPGSSIPACATRPCWLAGGDCRRAPAGGSAAIPTHYPC